MPVLFEHEMALAAVDPWKLRSVHYFDRMGRWTASATGMSKAEAKKRAAKGRRRARREMEESVMKKVHWSGGVKLPKSRMLPGWPCCCSGRAAEKVAAEGNQTREPGEVTCQKCRANMMKAGLLEAKL